MYTNGHSSSSTLSSARLGICVSGALCTGVSMESPSDEDEDTGDNEYISDKEDTVDTDNTIEGDEDEEGREDIIRGVCFVTRGGWIKVCSAPVYVLIPLSRRGVVSFKGCPANTPWTIVLLRCVLSPVHSENHSEANLHKVDKGPSYGEGMRLGSRGRVWEGCRRY